LFILPRDGGVVARRFFGAVTEGAHGGSRPRLNQ